LGLEEFLKVTPLFSRKAVTFDRDFVLWRFDDLTHAVHYSKKKAPLGRGAGRSTGKYDFRNLPFLLIGHYRLARCCLESVDHRRCSLRRVCQADFFCGKLNGMTFPRSSSGIHLDAVFCEAAGHVELNDFRHKAPHSSKRQTSARRVFQGNNFRSIQRDSDRLHKPDRIVSAIMDSLWDGPP
jgi:hypothetical protein